MSEAPRQVFDIAGDVNHQGVLAEAGPYPYVDLDRVLAAPNEPFCLILDHLQDVQNLGTLLRTAEAMAVTGMTSARTAGGRDYAGCRQRIVRRGRTPEHRARRSYWCRRWSA